MNALLGVTYLVHDEKRQISLSDFRNTVSVYADEHIALDRTTKALPRLLNPVRSRMLVIGELPSVKEFSVTNFREMVWLTPRDEVDAAVARVDAVHCTGQLSTKVESIEPSRMLIHTDADKPAWLVLSELDFPGWSAEIDASPIPIHRANGMFRAVCVPPGEHRVSFAFHPWQMVREVMRAPEIWR